MADSLTTTGKVNAMNGIKTNIDGATLRLADNTPVATATVSSSDFTVSISGQLSNTSAISFTIDSGDVGKTVAVISLEDGADTQVFLDLNSTVSLTTAGTATIAVGDLTADL